ncbi:ABC transporter permease [Clostridium tagluense]|uniref:ABC transporter permease n=1 Tax=Clostridium tagluense TaxID=360422 RepID=UPI001C6E3397|nr:ABC transporter permease [Clostridium tagluense]MBW9159215.1 ABC transporter permease [Clostridium tagluense]WLC68193.1 ABC transporter permease [Clostridium tagluense]
MDVFFQELKRQLNFKRLLTYVLIAIALAGLWTWFIVGGATEDFLQQGVYKEYKGRSAIDAAGKDRVGAEGEMTLDKFQSGCDIFLKSLKGDKDSDVVITKDLLKYTVYADKLINQEFRLRTMTGKSTSDLLHIPKGAGMNFYENEDLFYGNYIDKNALNENEKTLSISLLDKVKKPYTYYTGFNQWNDGISHIAFFLFVLMVMLGVFSSSIISNDKENGMDEIITTTVKGRKSLTIAKISIPLIMASIIYLCGVGLYVLLLKYLLPADALNTSIQVLSRSFLPYTQGDLLRNVFMVGWIGILIVSSFSTWISSISKKSSRAIQFSILTILGSFILGAFMTSHSRNMDIIKMFIPGGIGFSYFQSIDFPFITILGKTLWMPSILLIASAIIFLLSTIFTTLNYRRR